VFGLPWGVAGHSLAPRPVLFRPPAPLLPAAPSHRAVKTAWKTQPWTWGGDDAAMLAKDKAAVHAFHVPGLGWFGGFPLEIAEHIVKTVNASGLVPAYVIAADGNTITCCTCGQMSSHPEDVRQRYCGYCHVFHEKEKT
jgi:hypothetical protein